MAVTHTPSISAQVMPVRFKPGGQCQLYAFAEDILALVNDDIVVGPTSNALERRLVWRVAPAGAIACYAYGVIGQIHNNFGQISRIADAGDIEIRCAHG